MSKKRNKEFNEYSRSSPFRLREILNDDSDTDSDGGDVNVTEGSYKFI